MGNNPENAIFVAVCVLLYKYLHSFQIFAPTKMLNPTRFSVSKVEIQIRYCFSQTHNTIKFSLLLSARCAYAHIVLHLDPTQEQERMLRLLT